MNHTCNWTGVVNFIGFDITGLTVTVYFYYCAYGT